MDMVLITTQAAAEAAEMLLSLQLFKPLAQHPSQ
jgi:hypothetical protein